MLFTIRLFPTSATNSLSLKAYYLIPFFLLISNVLACKEDDAFNKYPSNLILQATVSQDGSGLVNFSSAANNVSHYDYSFGTSPDEVPTLSKDGNVSYTYQSSGDYTVKVRAYSSNNQYISQTKQITVKVGITEEPKEPEIPRAGYTTPENYEGMNLVWRDEFKGTELSNDWTFETGNGSNGWGNNELQYYKKENTEVKDGYLTITARKEQFSGSEYTSSRIITKGKRSFKYGRVDIRAQLPQGQGIWPALWMLGSNLESVGWPACGEIDIMEMIGGGAGRDNKIYGTPHWKNADGNAVNYGGNYQLPSGLFSDKFHVFSIVWDASTIKWYMDDIQYHVIDITPAELSEFQNDFFFIMNVAVGGNWPGNPNNSTVFPQKMVVDYVRIFQKK